MFSPQLIGAAILALLFVGSNVSSYLHGKKVAMGEQAHAKTLIQAAVDAATDKTAQAIASIKIEQRNIYQKVQREVTKEPVYVDCKHSPDGLLQLNRALTNGEPAGGVELPGHHPPGG